MSKKKPFWKRPIKEWGVVRVIGRTLGGENKVGETIHGVLDNSPFPNQIIVKGFKALFAGDKRTAKEEFAKAFTIRNGIATLVSVLILTGTVTLEDVKGWIKTLNNVLEVINNFKGF